MTIHDDNPDTTATGTDSSVISQLRERIAKLEAENKTKTDEAAAAGAAQRELAFFKAGVDPDIPGANWFIKGYDGELTDEAIKAEATKAGFLRGTAPQGQQGQQGQQQQSGAGQAAADGTVADMTAEQIAAAGQAAMTAATANPVCGGGPTQHELLRKAGRERGVAGITEYMQSLGLAVEGTYVEPAEPQF